MSNESTKYLTLIPNDDLTNFTQKLEEIEKTLSEFIKNSTTSQFDWIESEKGRSLLGVCKTTWKTYRDKRLIPFSQIGSKIFVKTSDIDSFLEANKISTIK